MCVVSHSVFVQFIILGVVLALTVSLVLIYLEKFFKILRFDVFLQSIVSKNGFGNHHLHLNERVRRLILLRVPKA